MPVTATPRQNQLLAALPESALERLSPALELVRMPLGKVLHESGKRWSSVYFPTTAVISLLYVVESGEAAEVAVIGNEGMIGITVFMGDETLPNRDVVKTAGHAYRLDGKILQEEFNRFGGRRSGALNHLLLGYTQALVTQLARGMFSLIGVLDSIYEGIITIDGSGKVRAFNKAAEHIFEYTAAEVIGQNVNILMPEPYRTEHDGYLDRYLTGGKPQIIGMGRQVSGKRKSGEEFPLHLSVTELRRSTTGNDRVFIGVVRDVSLENAARQRIEFLAKQDPLTGLSNRAGLTERLVQVCAQAHQSPSALLFIDLDYFKPINDQFGHEAGDQALITVARRMRHSLDELDFVGRLGGDEFVVLLLSITDLASVLHVAERLLQSIAMPIYLGGQECRLGASIGVALLPLHGDTPNQILSAADSAMYAAKRAGKNQIVVWSAELSNATPPTDTESK